MKRAARAALTVVALSAGISSAACKPSSSDAPPAPQALPAAAPGTEKDAFRDILASSGIDFVQVLADGALDSLPESVGAGCTAIDYDGDGRMDLYFVAQAWSEAVNTGEPKRGATRNRLYRNDGGGKFTDVTDKAGVGFEDFAFMSVAADFDDDGRTDLFIAAEHANRLLRNRGDGTFEDVTKKAGITQAVCTVAACAFDANGDGLLDLYLGNYVTFDKNYRLYFKPVVFPGPLAFGAQADILYVNNGDGTFTDGTKGSGFDVAEPGRAMGVSILDYDVDGKPDLYVANDATANFMFHNEGAGKFKEVGTSMGLAYGVQGDATAAMAGMTGDINEDGRPDMHVTDNAYGSMFVSNAKGGYTDKILSCGVAGASGQWPSWGGGFFDFDADGHLDLYLVNGDLYRATGRPDLLFRGAGDGTFEDVSVESGAYFRTERPGRGGCVVDIDGDARMDVVVTNIGDRPAVLHNQTRSGHAVLVALKSGRKGASGQGAKVTVAAGGKSWTQVAWPRQGYITCGDARLHFGIGAAEKIERITVEWADGTKTEAKDLARDRVWTAEQGGKVQ
ncbi:MAG: CRTAC1 family protein [Planctomycetes bacterium]|nr:CRTAC1 family protein [Planctomycetota bacterium]